MISNAISKEKTAIINTLLAEVGVTVDELFHCRELTNANIQVSPIKRYLNITEVCHLCSVSRYTIHRWRKKGWIRYCKLSNARGGRILIEAASLFRFLENRSHDFSQNN